MKKMIIKLQVTKITNEGYPQCLVYNEDRSFESQFDAPEELIELMGGEEVQYKGFWKVNVYDDGKIELIEGLEDQGW